MAAAAFAFCDTPPMKPTPPTIAPISYFEDRCARCHGPHGSFYGDDFGKKLPEPALRKVVSDMCRVQGDSPLKGVDLDAEVAYHRALIAGDPFIVVIHAKDGRLSGEVTEKAAVTVKFKRSTVSAEVKLVSWSVSVPKGEKAEDAVVTATLQKRSTVVRLVKECFSHAKAVESGSAKPKGDHPATAR